MIHQRGVIHVYLTCAAFKYSCNKKMCSTSTDCLNGGTCHDNVCHCRGHFFGDHCETGR